MNVFERYLTLWVFLCIVAGIVMGQLLPGPIQAIGRMEWAQRQPGGAALIWVMIYPDDAEGRLWSCLKDVGRRPRGLALTLAVNWLIKPFTMAGWGCCSSAPVLRAGAGRGRAAVHRGHDPAGGRALHGDGVRVEPADPGDANYTLVQVSVNDLIMVFAFAPMAACCWA
jgi:ACR3 family arsenite transporter